MAVIFEVVYHGVVIRNDIVKLDAAWKKKIKAAIEEKLTTNPATYGKPLRRSLKGYRKLRVGDYRIVFRIEVHRVLVFGIVHRAMVYSTVRRRISSA